VTEYAPALRAASLVGALSAALLLGVAPPALARPASGERGYVKVHKATTAVSDRGDNPNVCRFYLDGFNFGIVRQINWKVVQQPSGRHEMLHGSLTAAAGFGHTKALHLPNGRYQLSWTFVGGQGGARHTNFKVSCPPD
jgi:hypothetical protein